MNDNMVLTNKELLYELLDVWSDIADTELDSDEYAVQNKKMEELFDKAAGKMNENDELLYKLLDSWKVFEKVLEKMD